MPKKKPMTPEEHLTAAAKCRKVLSKLKPPKRKYCVGWLPVPTEWYMRYLERQRILESLVFWHSINAGGPVRYDIFFGIVYLTQG